MKVLVLGDIHGSNKWKDIILKENDCDLVIFIGDYLDSFSVSIENQIENFKDILQYKNDNSDKVILLLGNHDYHYSSFCPSGEYYSGFKSVTRLQTRDILDENIKNGNIKICHLLHGKYLLSHAGFSKTWVYSVNAEKLQGQQLVDYINDLLLSHPIDFAFNGFDSYGDNTSQGPLWVRPRSLAYDKFEDYIQIVGHTGVKRIDTGIYPTKQMILIDCLAERNSNIQYLIIEEGVPYAKVL